MRLPIQEHLTSPQNTVLNIDTVIALLSSFSSTNDWAASIDATLPKRKKEMGGKKKRYLEKKASEQKLDRGGSEIDEHSS